MKFEDAFSTYFVFFYGNEPLAEDEPEVYLGNCGGGGVSILGEDMPSGLDGAIAIKSAKGYWIDSNGEKLIYKHSCAPHCSGSSVYTSANGGWHFAPELIGGLKAALAGTKTRFSIDNLFTMTSRHLLELSRQVPAAIVSRRTFVAGSIERSVRAQEDDAQARLTAAGVQFSECRAFQARGDLKSALVSCDAALQSLLRAQSDLAVAATWMPTQ